MAEKNKGFTKEEALQIAYIDLAGHNQLEILTWLWDTAFAAGQDDVFTHGSMKVTNREPKSWTEYQ